MNHTTCREFPSAWMVRYYLGVGGNEELCEEAFKELWRAQAFVGSLSPVCKPTLHSLYESFEESYATVRSDGHPFTGHEGT